jgi:hypothetical protein
MNSTRWKRVFHDGDRLYDIGRNADGTLHNPNGYPEELVRAAIDGAEERQRQRRSNAAKKAAETRRRRTEARIYQVARRIVDGEVFGPSDHCDLCGRGLDDPESIKRGIGSDCWQFVLDIIKAPA